MKKDLRLREMIAITIAMLIGGPEYRGTVLAMGFFAEYGISQLQAQHIDSNEWLRYKLEEMGRRA